MDFSNQETHAHIPQTPGITSETLPEPFLISDFVPPEDTAGSFFNDAQLMGLGMTESLPPLEVMEELYEHRSVNTHIRTARLTFAATTRSLQTNTFSSP